MSNDSLSGISFKIEDGKGFYKAAGADAWSPFNSHSLLYVGQYSGNATNIDIAAIEGNYADLTEDNFLIEIITVPGISNHSFGTVCGKVTNSGITPVKAYNSSTGSLSVSGMVLTGSVWYTHSSGSTDYGTYPKQSMTYNIYIKTI